MNSWLYVHVVDNIISHRMYLIRIINGTCTAGASTLHKMQSSCWKLRLLSQVAAHLFGLMRCTSCAFMNTIGVVHGSFMYHLCNYCSCNQNNLVIAITIIWYTRPCSFSSKNMLFLFMIHRICKLLLYAIYDMFNHCYVMYDINSFCYIWLPFVQAEDTVRVREWTGQRLLAVTYRKQHKHAVRKDVRRLKNRL